MDTLTDKRVVKTKNLLKKALVQLLEKKQLNDISIVELTNLAEVNRKTFYLHYKNVSAIFKEIKNGLLSAVKTVIERFDTSISNIEKFVADFAKVVIEDIFAFHILRYTQYAFNIAESIVTLSVEQLLKKYQENNVSKSTFTIEFYVYGGVRLFYQWIRNNNSLDIDSFAKRLSSLILEGIN